MFDALAEATSLIEGLVRELDPACLSSADAVAGLDAFSRAERLCAAGRVLCAGRAAETRAYERDGDRTAAVWLARRTGQSVGEAIGALQAAAQADGSPLGEALRAGQLSGQQAAAVAEAVAVDPGCSGELLQAARSEPLKRLREKAREAKAAAEGEAAMVLAEERLRQRRFLRTFVGKDGALRGEFALAPLDGARFLSALSVEQEVVFAAARRRQEYEGAAAYAADALVALAERPPGDGRAVPELVLTCDLGAFSRGSVQPGETCQIPGIGPVPVATARSVLGEAFLKLVVTDGVDIVTVCHPGRTIPAHLRTALEVRDPRCVVPGCSESFNMEIDHWRVPYGKGGPTELDNLCRICRPHHRQKTHRGFVLDGGPGAWRWTPPRIFVDLPAPTAWGPNRVDASPPEPGPAPPEDRPPPEEAMQLALV
jgi:hypothetical protein